MLRTRTLAPALLAAAAIVTAAPVASAALVTSFESEALGSAVGQGTVVNTGPGITDGAQAVRATLLSTSSYQNIANVNLSGVTPGTTAFVVDWNYQYDGASDGFLGLTAALFSGLPTPAGGFNQLVGMKAPGSNEFIGNANAQYTVTYTLDASEQALLDTALTTPGTFIQLQLFGNKAATRLGTLTVDNVQFTPAVAVPEPTAGLALAGVAGAVGLRRRRA